MNLNPEILSAEQLLENAKINYNRLVGSLNRIDQFITRIDITIDTIFSEKKITKNTYENLKAKISFIESECRNRH